ncbi:MAG TPA: hypothetical protein IAA98_07125 [Candidatus Avipropionibacterium avicola]|uniref:Signal transduction histidine kinase subgroup 3 dimerisation and phosphoacceptor domain-containing protein n=1 Tax=Candidatus Avipropionibacterium avicola TaxID=2840701 RepID=A0A9D1GX21_9ACTN|nr:hypothetical protein [Candidatus Avipropionibacterium avicola]
MSRPRTNPDLLIRYLQWGVRVVPVSPLLGAAAAAAAAVGDGRVELTWRDAVGLVVWTVGLLGVDVWTRWALRRLAGEVASLRDRRRRLAASVVTVVSVVVLPLIVGAEGWWPVAIGCVVLVQVGAWVMVLRLWQAALVAGAATVVAMVAAVTVLGWTEQGGMWVGGLLVAVPILVLSWWFSAWHLRVLHELREARDLAARAAVSDERARISRDLHDVFGQTLAAIAVKSELAAELASRGGGEAAAEEMREVHRIADRAGAKVREVVRGASRVDLTGEIDGARSLLSAAQVDCRVSGDETVPAGTDVLAWVLRESVTNILRHSGATRAEIELTTTPTEVRLRVANDGVPETTPDDPLAASSGGLAAMVERVGAVGGSISVNNEAGWFAVEAQVPVPAETVPAEAGPTGDSSDSRTAEEVNR